MRAALAVVMAVGVALTMAVPAAIAQSRRPPGWALWPAPACPRNAECGVIAPPLVEADPLGRTNHATYAFLRATKQPVLGTVAFNPGGPGSSAIAWAKDIATFLGPEFNLLLVDPRGVGASGALDCGMVDDVFIRPLGTQLRELAGCGWRLGDQPEQYGTDEAADDLDAVRERLGIQQLDLWGQSYGTLLMTTYARRHPIHVRSLLLSGAYPVDTDPWSRDRAAALRRAILLVCARDGGCDGQTVLRDIRRLATKLREKPLRFSLTYGFRRYPQWLDEGVFAYAVFSAAYEPRRYGRLPRIVREALDGRPRRLIRLARRDLIAGASLSAAAARHAVMLRYALTCREEPVPYDPAAPVAARRAEYERELRAIGRIEPFSASGWMTGLATPAISCLEWPAHRRAALDAGELAEVPALVANGDLDAVTPPAEGQAVARQIPGARFIQVRNVGHVPEIQDPTGCVGDLYWRFLRTRRVPRMACLEHVPAVLVR